MGFYIAWTHIKNLTLFIDITLIKDAILIQDVNLIKYSSPIKFSILIKANNQKKIKFLFELKL